MRKVTKAKAKALKAAQSRSPKRAAAAAKNYSEGSDAENEDRKPPVLLHESDEDKSEEETYEVESILASRVRHGKQQFKIRWKGFGPADDCWEDEENIDSPDLIAAYLKEPDKQKGKIISTSGGLNLKSKGSKRGARTETSVSKKVKYEEGNGADIWEVSKIIEDVELKDGTRQFLVRWKGFTSKEDTWEPEANLNCPDLIKKYLERLDEREQSSRETRTERKQVYKYNPVLSKRKSHRSVKSGGVDIISHQQQQDDSSFSNLAVRHTSSWSRSRGSYNLNMSSSSQKSSDWFSKFPSQCSVM